MTNPLFPTSLFALQPEGVDTGDQWHRKFCRSKSKIVSRSRSHVLQNIKFNKKFLFFCNWTVFIIAEVINFKLLERYFKSNELI